MLYNYERQLYGTRESEPLNFQYFLKDTQHESELVVDGMLTKILVFVAPTILSRPFLNAIEVHQLDIEAVGSTF